MKNYRRVSKIAVAAVIASSNIFANAQTIDQVDHTARQAHHAADVQKNEERTDRHAADVRNYEQSINKHLADVAKINKNAGDQKFYQRAANAEHYESLKDQHSADNHEIKEHQDAKFYQHEKDIARDIQNKR